MRRHFLLRVFFRLLPLAGLTTAVCGLVYLTAQQMYRQTANDPQVQMAREVARQLDAGYPVGSVIPAGLVDMGNSLAPYVMVLDNAGRVIASSGRLHDQARGVPAGVLDTVRAQGEERVTWQPERGVRLATVVVRRGGTSGFVLAGRSLGETEARTFEFGRLVVFAWAAILAGLFALVGVSEYALRA